MCVWSTNVLVQWQACGFCCCVCNCERDTENGVCAVLALVSGAVELDQASVDCALVFSVKAFFNESWTEDVVDCCNCGLNTLAEVTGLVAVTELNCFECAGGCTGWNTCVSDCAIFKNNLNLEGWVSTRVEDLESAYGFDKCHCGAPSRDLSLHTKRTGPVTLREGLFVLLLCAPARHLVRAGLTCEVCWKPWYFAPPPVRVWSKYGGVVTALTKV